jgi:hypothetical protein
MTDELDQLDGVRDHYRAIGLTGRLKAALAAFGPEDQLLTTQQLGALDQFHTRGLPATVALAKLAGVTASTSVLDIGSGLGGRPAIWPRRTAVKLRASTSVSLLWTPPAI